MAQKTEVKPRLAILIEPCKVDQSYGSTSGSWNLSVVRIDPKDEKPRNCSRDDYDTDATHMFDDLAIRGHFSWYDGKFTLGGFYVEYLNVYSIDLRTLETLSKGLKRCEKIRASFPIQPETFGQFVCLLAAGLGIKECVRKYGQLGSHVRESSSYLDYVWQILPLSSAQHMIDTEMDRVRDTVIPPSEMAQVA